MIVQLHDRSGNADGETTASRVRYRPGPATVGRRIRMTYKERYKHWTSAPRRGYERCLDIDHRRLLPKHSMAEEWAKDAMMEGTHCNCCPGPRRWVFPNVHQQDRLDVRKRRFRYLNKARSELIWRQREAAAALYGRNGRDDDGWWQEMVARYGPRTI